LIADILVVSERYAARNPQTLARFAEGWIEGVGLHWPAAGARLYVDRQRQGLNIPADLSKTMLEGVKLADGAENKAFFGSPGTSSDYAGIFKMAQQMYHELGVLRGAASDPEGSVDRKIVASIKKVGAHCGWPLLGKARR